MTMVSKTRDEGVPRVEYTAKDVIVLGVRVMRPQSISPSQWLRYWEHATGRGS